MTVSEAAFAPGTLVAGKYRVQRMLGEGGYGVVVAAEHIALGGRVAIKVLRSELVSDHEVVERFLREGRAAVRIKGEHVTRVLDVGELPTGEPFMVMEYLDGHDLGHIVDTRGPLPIPVAVDYLLQACEALAEAHGLGIIHRDVKPSNLFLTMTADGSACVKVLDFGISKLVSTEADGTTAKLTQTQAILGSPQYMAPEQMRTSRAIDRRTDIWALGGTLFELLAGRPPFEAKAMAELFAQILEDPAPLLTTFRPDAPPELARVLAKCLEKQPDRRFNDVHELAMALAPFSSTGEESTGRIRRLGLRASQSSEGALPMAKPPSQPAVNRTVRLEAPVTTGSRRRSLALPIGLGLLVGIALLGGGLAAFGRFHSRSTPTASATPGSVSKEPPEIAVPLPPATGVIDATPVVSVSSSNEPAASGSTSIKRLLPAPHLKPTATPTPKPNTVASSRYD